MKQFQWAERLERFIWLQDKVIFSCKNQHLSCESHLSYKRLTIHFNSLWIFIHRFLQTEVLPGMSSYVFLSMVIDVFQLLLWHFLKYISMWKALSIIPFQLCLAEILYCWALLIPLQFAALCCSWSTYLSVPSHGFTHPHSNPNKSQQLELIQIWTGDLRWFNKTYFTSFKPHTLTSFHVFG